MTLIFIKSRFQLAGDGVDPFGSPYSGERRGEAVMRTDVQRSGSRAGAAKADESTRSVVSTLNLCNANFGPRLA